MAAQASAPDWAEAALDAMLARCLGQLRPRRPLNCLQWAEKFRTLSKEESPDFGGALFSTHHAPAMRGVLSLIGVPGIKRIVGQKAAQITWTGGVVASALGYHIHWKPCTQVVLFPRETSAKDFDGEKFSPMVQATKVLRKRVAATRADGNSTTRKRYPGGIAKFVASNSPAGVKSTSASFIVVEEPDDTNRNVKGQGKSIVLVRERGKTIRTSIMLIGGTPTAQGASEVVSEMRTTDQRRLMVECHHCSERHDLDWDYVTIPGLQLSDEQLKEPDLDERYPPREVYGRAKWEDAYYACPHCGGVWTDEERCDNIRRTTETYPDYGWVASANSPDPGFYYNELHSVFEGSYVPVLAEKYLRAKDLLDRGDQTEMISFWNSSRGLPWEYRGELPEEDELRERAEDYAEWSCPAGALVPKLTVDVQHDRLAVTCWVTGRNEERWLAFWGELHGATVVPHQGAWIDLAQMLHTQKVLHASGAKLDFRAVAIDCSDGQTSDAVYAFVRQHDRPGRPVCAVKGASDDRGVVEIWTPAKAKDPSHKKTKADKFGVHVSIVGAARAKDLILGWSEKGGQVRLTGNGPGRMHWYKGVRDDFFEQLLSEIKIPSPRNLAVRVWKPRTDRRNECLDCTVYDTWLSRHLRLHVKKPWEWNTIEMRMKQGDLYMQSEMATADTAEPEPQPAAVLSAPAPVHTRAHEAPAQPVAVEQEAEEAVAAVAAPVAPAPLPQPVRVFAPRTATPATPRRSNRRSGR